MRFSSYSFSRRGLLVFRRSFCSEKRGEKRVENLSSFLSSSKSRSKLDLKELLINMPKEMVHIPSLKGQRKTKKEAGTKYPAGYISLQVLGNGGSGLPASLYVFTDQTRYLFNCGEGTQRLAHEYKMKLAKLEHVFITESCWSKIGGLPGVALTIQDIGVPSITLHGPPGLENLFEGTRRFVILKDLQVQVADSTSETDNFFEDHVMRIEYVPLFKSTSAQQVDKISQSSEEEEEEEIDEIDYYAPIKGGKRQLTVTQGPLSKKSREEEKRVRKRADSVSCYICKPKRKQGMLLIEKCLEKGVPSGPLLGQLKAGNDVTLPDGRIVKAQEVRSPDARVTVFIVVDCPSEDYLPSLLSNETLSKYQGDPSEEEDLVHVLIHFTPPHILHSTPYLEWMRKFRLTVSHLVLNSENSCLGSEAVHRAQHMLHLIDSDMFPILEDERKREMGGEKGKEDRVVEYLSIIKGETLLKYNLRPSIGFDSSGVVVVDGKAYLEDALSREGLEQSLVELKNKLQNHTEPVIEYPKLVFLGTGSCIPNKTRNTSGIFIEISKESCMIMDCGEGTFGQLAHFYGSEQLDKILLKLKTIYISHLHADHHLGLLTLLKERQQSFLRCGVEFMPLTLIAPHQIESWLHLFHSAFEPIKTLYTLLPTTHLLLNSNSGGSFEFSAMGLSKVQTVPVRHCPNAYGVAITDLNGRKITYSGDTMPCDFLVTLGEGSDLLIHEATMEDELADEAELKMHSTVSDAISIGRKMRAKFILLTHFSQRYSKVPKINGGLEEDVGIAFDNMSLRLSDLRKIPLMYPLLKVLFAESYEDMENKTAKKLKRKDRKSL